MKFFTYDNVNECIIINQPEILLVKEFRDLTERSDKEKKGKGRSRAFKELTYIYLFFDWESPYFNITDQDRHNESLKSSGLSDEEFNDSLFRIACNKYDEIQKSKMSIRLLKAAMSSVENVIYYLENIDINERNPIDGKPIIKTKDLITEIKGSKDLIATLQELEKQVKKDIEPDSGLRGNTEAGFYD